MTNIDSKTDRILLLLQTLKDAPYSRLREETVKEILGNPSRASFYRLISTLLSERGNLKPLIIKFKIGDEIYFGLNRQEWRQFAEINDETNFLLHCMISAPHHFSILAQDLGVFEKKNIKGIDQKFIHLDTKKKCQINSYQKDNLQKIMKSIIVHTKMLITFNHSTFDIIPLTLCQFRNELYILGAKNEFQERNLLAINLNHIEKVIETRNSFTYPSPSRYNPEFLYERIQDFILGSEDEILSQLILNDDATSIPENLRQKLVLKAEKILKKFGDK